MKHLFKLNYLLLSLFSLLIFTACEDDDATPAEENEEEVITDVKLVFTPTNTLSGLATGENSIIIHGGANNCIEKKQIDNVLSYFNEGDYIILQNEINNVNEIIEKAYKRGLIIFFNPAPYSIEINNYCLEKVNTLICNESEGKGLSGRTDEMEIIDA